ncbi:unnamed protein product [Moneuplotes crassus]|uniref:Uncharacterized protein n=1 Tax=Euplotes crassus TaxID=5936 RepID=A0AAD1XLZ6_EUPCR|nr:unnamed protein product [Moneuplotes crassus]
MESSSQKDEQKDVQKDLITNKAQVNVLQENATTKSIPASEGLDSMQQKTNEDHKLSPKEVYGDPAHEKQDTKRTEKSKSKKKCNKKLRSKSNSRSRFVLDGIKHSQYGIPDYFYIKNGISTTKFKRSKANKTMRKHERQSLPKLKNTESQKEDINAEKARKRIRTIIIDNVGKVLKLKNNKSSLLKYIKNKPGYRAGIAKYSKNKLLENPYLIPTIENYTGLHKESETIKLPSLNRSSLDKSEHNQKKSNKPKKNTNIVLKLKSNESINNQSEFKPKIVSNKESHIKPAFKRGPKNLKADNPIFK